MIHYQKSLFQIKSQGAFFWIYSGIGILGIDGICVLLGAIPFSEYHSVHSAPDSRMNRIDGIRFTQNRQNTHSFGKMLSGNPLRLLSPVAPGRYGSSQVTSAMGIHGFQILEGSFRNRNSVYSVISKPE